MPEPERGLWHLIGGPKAGDPAGAGQMTSPPRSEGGTFRSAAAADASAGGVSRPPGPAFLFPARRV